MTPLHYPPLEQKKLKCLVKIENWVLKTSYAIPSQEKSNLDVIIRISDGRCVGTCINRALITIQSMKQGC